MSTPPATNWGGSGITEAMYQWIRKHLPDGRHILELGSGDVSTKNLAPHYRLTSVEDNPAFLHRHPSRYIYAPLVDGWYDLAVLRGTLPDDYDLILVDGPVGSEPRLGFLKNLGLFKITVPFIVDDTWRAPEMQMARELAALLGDRLEIHETFCAVVPPAFDLGL